MQIKRTEFKGIAEDVTILDGNEAQRAMVRIARYHEVPVDTVRDELAGGIRLTTCGAMYEATVAPAGATVMA